MRVVALVVLLAALSALSGCGSSSSTPSSPSEDQVILDFLKDAERATISVDHGPKGDPSLTKDRYSGNQNQRIAVTPKGVRTEVFSLAVNKPRPKQQLRALATITLTKCAITDYIPHYRAHTACQGTPRYSFSPVDVRTYFALVDKKGRIIRRVGSASNFSCSTKLHHCTITQIASTNLRRSDRKATDLTFSVQATSDKARSCLKPSAHRCDVLAVETQKGEAMYMVQIKHPSQQRVKPISDTQPAINRLKVQTGHKPNTHARRVIYSIELAPSQTSALKGAQFEVLSKVQVSERLPQAPLISGYLVLANSPTATTGRYLISDSYNPNETGNSGGNCDKRCQYLWPAVVTAIRGCDIKADRRYINVVVTAARAAAPKGESVKIGKGFIKTLRSYKGSSVTRSSGRC